MKAGWACAELPVPLGSEMGGYVNRPTGATGVHDPLLLHALTFHDDRGVRVALVVADVVCINRDVVTAARKRTAELGVQVLWVAATHTHASPNTGCLPGGAPTPSPWDERLPTQIRDVVAAALRVERIVDARWTATQIVGVGGVRSGSGREAALPVTALSLHAPEEGRPLAVFASFPCHATVLGPENTGLSADLPGGIRRALAGALATDDSRDPVWVAVATGAAGDISTRHQRRARSVEECDRLGRLVADRIVRALPDSAGAWRSSHGPLLHHASALSRMRTRRWPADWPTDGRESRDAVAAVQASRSRPNDELEIEIAAITLGSITLVSVPGELFLELGESLLEAVGDQTMLLGYANGYIGYIPPRRAYDSSSYEVLVSPLPPGSGEELIRAAGRVARRTSMPQEDD